MHDQKSLRGLIFNIQKFSVNDGPGIRTNVFLKGCPLRCRWCANPESQLHRVQILWDNKKCVQCHHCLELCPEQAISLTGIQLKWNVSACTGCQQCVNECPQHALSSAGEWKSVEEVLQVCLQDRDFYEESHGGVTLSGGEVLSSPDFAIALLTKLQQEGIHTAIETSGYAAESSFLSVIAHTDLLLFDMKHWQPQRHKEGTGVSNELPLANMRLAITHGKDVLPRIPVIPGYNDTLSDAAGFAQRLKDVGAARVQLLPFHQFGQNKYHLLGQDYAYADTPALHPEELTGFQQVFLEHDIQAFF
jgi:pyruvate formate lyase activating enzyme